MALSRRLPVQPPRLSALPNLQRVAQVQEGFNRELLGLVTGIPAGFNNRIPATVEAGEAAVRGVQEDGWPSAKHKHAVVTAAPGVISLGQTAIEGTGPALARANHLHDTRILLAQIRNLISLRC